MITSSDIDYLETKLIKQGKKELEPPLRDLAEWIKKEFNVNVINIHYDYIQNERPRLGIILEFKTDERKFYKDNYNYDHKKQLAISEKFNEILILKGNNSKANFLFKWLKKESSIKYDTKDIFVSFNSFEPIAREEANNRIAEEKIQELKNKLNKDLWLISRFFSSTTFFFFTDDQVKEHSVDGSLDIFKEAYFNLLKPYDEFDYINKENFSIYIDSKENFDKNFKSNWYYYYK